MGRFLEVLDPVLEMVVGLGKEDGVVLELEPKGLIWRFRKIWFEAQTKK